MPSHSRFANREVYDSFLVSVFFGSTFGSTFLGSALGSSAFGITFGSTAIGLMMIGAPAVAQGASTAQGAAIGAQVVHSGTATGAEPWQLLPWQPLPLCMRPLSFANRPPPWQLAGAEPWQLATGAPWQLATGAEPWHDARLPPNEAASPEVATAIIMTILYIAF